MEQKPKQISKPEVRLSPEEKVLETAIDVRTNSIESFASRESLSLNEMFELSDMLNESYYDLLPKLKKDHLKSLHDEFALVIYEADHDLVSYICNLIDESIDSEEKFDNDEIGGWKIDINKLKTKVIPRLKEDGLGHLVKELEGKIIDLEIRMASDFEE